jgi:hypothetical protein
MLELKTEEELKAEGRIERAKAAFSGAFSNKLANALEKGHQFVAEALEKGDMHLPCLNDAPPKANSFKETVTWTGGNKLLERLFVVPRVSDLGCAQQRVSAGGSASGEGVTESDLRAFASLPLAPIDVARFVDHKSRSQAGLDDLPTDTELGVNISKHPAAATQLATRSLTRIMQDVTNRAKAQNDTKLVGLRLSGQGDPALVEGPEDDELAHMLRLITTLEELHARDAAFLEATAVQAVHSASLVPHETSASPGPVAFSLLQHAGQEIKVGFKLLLNMFLCTDGAAALRRLNPFLSAEAANRVLSLTGSCLMAGSRMGQVARCLALARELRQSLEALEAQARGGKGARGGGDLVRTIEHQSAALASLLTARRHYVTLGGAGELTGGGEAVFDPRFLLFEFIYNILLHKSQVELIAQFLKAVRGGRSMCHQMIMGAGKTTVVAPLLALILADGKRLVTQV